MDDADTPTHGSQENPPEESTAAQPESSIPTLTFEETRVLGCLLEKEMTTPENYPLSLNALSTACNQKSNRDPIVSFDSATVTSTVESLRYKQFAVTIHEAGARVPKTKHAMDRVFPYLEKRHFAIIAVLLLRGQQTLGELRQRTERMFAFPNLESTQAALDELIHYEPEPLVKHFAAGGGRRVPTFAHLLSGEIEDGPATASSGAVSPAAAASPAPEVEIPTWREEIEKSIKELRAEVGELREELRKLRGGQ